MQNKKLSQYIKVIWTRELVQYNKNFETTLNTDIDFYFAKVFCFYLCGSYLGNLHASHKQLLVACLYFVNLGFTFLIVIILNKTDNADRSKSFMI